jgi:hypothetical protein
MDDDDLDPTSPLDLSRAEVEYVGTRGGGTTPTKSMSFPCKVPLVATRVREEAGRREIMEERAHLLPSPTFWSSMRVLLKWLQCHSASYSPLVGSFTATDGESLKYKYDAPTRLAGGI